MIKHKLPKIRHILQQIINHKMPKIRHILQHITTKHITTKHINNYTNIQIMTENKLFIISSEYTCNYDEYSKVRIFTTLYDAKQQIKQMYAVIPNFTLYGFTITEYTLATFTTNNVDTNEYKLTAIYK